MSAWCVLPTAVPATLAAARAGYPVHRMLALAVEVERAAGRELPAWAERAYRFKGAPALPASWNAEALPATPVLNWAGMRGSRWGGRRGPAGAAATTHHVTGRSGSDRGSGHRGGPPQPVGQGPIVALQYMGDGSARQPGQPTAQAIFAFADTRLNASPPATPRAEGIPVIDWRAHFAQEATQGGRAPHIVKELAAAGGTPATGCTAGQPPPAEGPQLEAQHTAAEWLGRIPEPESPRAGFEAAAESPTSGFHSPRLADTDHPRAAEAAPEMLPRIGLIGDRSRQR